MESVLGTVIAILGFFGVSFVIEKTPIKINPLSAMRKFLVGDIEQNVSDLKDTINNMEIKNDENEKDRLRYTILQYKKSLDNGIPMTEHEYEYVLRIFDKYKNVLHGNSFVCEVVKDIQRMYEEQERKEKEEKNKRTTRRSHGRATKKK